MSRTSSTERAKWRTREEVEAQVREDYLTHLGKILMVSRVDGFRGNGAEEIALDPPARFIVRATDESDLNRWNDPIHCDPRWVAEPVNPKDPRLAGFEAFTVFGLTRTLNSLNEGCQEWETQEAFDKKLLADLDRLAARFEAADLQAHAADLRETAFSAELVMSDRAQG